MDNCVKRHIGVKDLENYLKKDDYLSGYSKSEQQEVRKNLGILEKGDIAEIVKSYLQQSTKITYEGLLELVNNKQLAVGNTYIISDFQTIYKSNTDEVWGIDDNHPSKVYNIIVRAESESVLAKDVRILSDYYSKSLLWEVQYDITPKTFDEIQTKGTITYLKDENGNSAYFDFKNIQYRINNTDYYTFNGSASNVTIKSGSTQNIFTNEAQNVNIDFDCHNNFFDITIKNTNFTTGINKVVINNSLFSENCLKTVQSVSGKVIVSYMDKDTLTVQNYEIDNIY